MRGYEGKHQGGIFQEYLVGHICLVQSLLSSKHSSKRILEERVQRTGLYSSAGGDQPRRVRDHTWGRICSGRRTLVGAQTCAQELNVTSTAEAVIAPLPLPPPTQKPCHYHSTCSDSGRLSSSLHPGVRSTLLRVARCQLQGHITALCTPRS